MTENLSEKNDAVGTTARVKKLSQEQIQEIHEKTVATVGVGNRVVRTTEFISDYTKFKLIESNRKVSPNYALLKDIKGNGQLSPVIVKKEGNKLIILDGQHRLFHLKQLGFPVEVLCITDDYKGDNFGAVQSLNVCSKNWTSNDYSEHYIKEGNQNYKKFSDAIREYSHLSATLIYEQVNGTKASNLTELYKNGNLKFNPSDSDYKIMEVLNDLIGAVEKSRKNKDNKQDKKNNYFDRLNVYKALKKYLENKEGDEEFDQILFKTKLEKNGYKIRASVDITDLSEIYAEKSLN